MPKRGIKTLLTVIAFIAVASSRAVGGEENPEETATGKNMVRKFQDGDRIVFIGDSITCGGFYHVFLNLFYATRYPKTRVRTNDCGIGGDTVAGALERLEWDILAHKPNKATVMLGTNDLGFRDYGEDKNDAASLKKQRESFDAYKANIAKLTARLLKENVEIVFLTSPIYDQTARTPAKNHVGFNDAIGALADYQKEFAAQNNSGFVDSYHLLKKLNAERQAKDPGYSIIGPDRCHPGQIGHFAMAYAFLKAGDHSKYVSKIVIDAAKGVVEEAVNGEISNLAASDTEVTFGCVENALPFPVPKHLKEVLKMVPFQEELNNEIVAIGGLRPGQYRLSIDGAAVGEYDAASLTRGVNLAENERTPQFKQALDVWKKTLKLRDMETHVRSYARIRHYYIKSSGIDFDDPNAFALECQKFLDKLPKNERLKIYRDMVAGAAKHVADKKKYEAEMEKAREDIYAGVRPVKHLFKVKKIK